MKFICPFCNKECDFEDIQVSNDLDKVIEIISGLGQHGGFVVGNLLWAYTRLFNISPLQKRAKKARIICQEIKSLFCAGAFSYRKKEYRISKAGIATALNQIVHRNFPDGLDGHNYLKKIMIGIAEQEAQQTGKQAERDLRKKENGLRYPMRTEGAQTESTPAMSPELRNQVDHLLGRK